jgi:hypothetical protein
LALALLFFSIKKQTAARPNEQTDIIRNGPPPQGERIRIAAVQYNTIAATTSLNQSTIKSTSQHLNISKSNIPHLINSPLILYLIWNPKSRNNNKKWTSGPRQSSIIGRQVLFELPKMRYCPHLHFEEEKYRANFNISIRDIQFTRNDYFLKNSRYIIYQANHKKQQNIKTRYVWKIGELSNLQINDRIAFSTCLYQDMPSKYLEKYIPNFRRIVIRQRTKINNYEYLIRDIAYFELPLHEICFQQSPVHYEYDLFDPDDGIDAIIHISIEFEILANHIPRQPNICQLFAQYLRRPDDDPATTQQDRHSVNQERLDILRTRQLGVYDYSTSNENQVVETMSPGDLDLLSQHRQQSILKKQGPSASPYHYTLGSFQQDLVELHPATSNLATKDQLPRLTKNSIWAENGEEAQLTEDSRLTTMTKLASPNKFPIVAPQRDVAPIGLLKRPLPIAPATFEAEIDCLDTTELIQKFPAAHTEVSRQMPSKRDAKDFFDFRRNSSLSAIDANSDNDDSSDNHSLSYSRSNVTSTRIASSGRCQSRNIGAISSSGSTSENDLFDIQEDEANSDGELRFPPSFVADVSAVQFIGEGISPIGPASESIYSRYFLNSRNYYNRVLHQSVSQNSPVFSRLNEDDGHQYDQIHDNRANNAGKVIKEKNLHDFGMIPMTSTLENHVSCAPTVGESTTTDLFESKEILNDMDEFAFGAAYYELNE